MRSTIFALIFCLMSSASLAHDVIVNRNSNLRSEPNSSSTVIKLLTEGNQARLLSLEKVGGYYQVLHRDGVGWLWGRNVTILPEYLRKLYRHWSDIDGDCQDTRQEVLIEESEIPVTFKSAEDCKVETGRWTDPYTGEVFTNPGSLDVDHMVPLQNAHRSGAWVWSFDQKKDYANDLDNPEHLIAVKASANRSKSAQGPANWKPPLQSYHCQYAQDWRAIKNRWGLTMTDDELAAVEEMETTCP